MTNATNCSIIRLFNFSTGHEGSADDEVATLVPTPKVEDGGG